MAGSDPTWYETDICADCARRQPFRVRQARQSRTVTDWPTGQSLFLMSHPDVSLVNILLSITRVSLVQNKCVFCQLRVHYSIIFR